MVTHLQTGNLDVNATSATNDLKVKSGFAKEFVRFDEDEFPTDYSASCNNVTKPTPPCGGAPSGKAGSVKWCCFVR